MNKSQIIALYDQDQRKDVDYPDMRREVTPNVVRHVNTYGSGEGAIIYSQLEDANADDTIREQVNYFESLGQDFEWKVYDYDRPPDLKERLGTYGFIVEEAEAIMVLDLEDAPEVLWQPVLQKVQRIKEPEKIADVLSVEQQVWNEDFSSLGHYLREALRNYPEQMSVYVAYIDGQLASTAWIYFPKHSQFASLWGGSTISGFRKHGLYTALLAVRAQEARARQVRYLTVDASPMSRPILEKFGFEMIAYSYPCKWKLKSQK
ncbi:MAG TPA: GNAT family N-acetyltransferase [Anaerolineales bacterium]|nr:GNAT family N-acetyltransferase [Anaerolineales bacterium]